MNNESNKSFSYSLDEIKRRIVLVVISFLLIASFPAITLTIISTKSLGLPPIIYIHIVIYLVILGAFIFNKKLTLNALIFTTIVSSVVLGSIGTINMGIVSVGLAYFIIGSVLASILLDKVYTYLISGLSVLIVIWSGRMYSTGWKKYDFDVTEYVVSPLTWATRAFITVFFLGIVIYSLSLMKDFLVETINQLNLKNNELIHVRDELVTSEEEHRIRNEELKANREYIKQLAYYDTLTGIPNRSLFLERFSEIINSARESNEKLAVFYIDLDNFKKVNDSMGHKAGDAILQKMTDRLKNIFIDADIISRMGGDEFAVLIRKFENEKLIIQRAQAFMDELGKSCTINGCTHYLSSSIGIAIYPYNGETAEELMKNVDTAMYRAKSCGRNNYKLFSNYMKVEIDEKVNMEMKLRDALKNNEMKINYQPLIDSETGSIRGFEALMRWNSNEYGLVSPVKFIPILEDTGLILLFGEWIMLNACKQNKYWHKITGINTVISINISAMQFKQKDFTQRVKNIIYESGLEPKWLEIEITESILIDDFYNVAEELKELQKIGIKIALDDFGTGYSSLNYLRLLSINTLKIDKSFIADIKIDNPHKSIIGSIVALAHDMQLEVVAEGVETQEQKMYLTEKKCDYLQGFYLYRPMDVESVEKIFPIYISSRQVLK